MKIIAYVFARGGSKGVPRKNLYELNGKSLLLRAIECAQQVPEISEVIVSTDDAEIAEVASAAGARVPFIRPGELATDDAAEWAAWQHAAKYSVDNGGASFDSMFVSVPATTPLKTSDVISQCIAKYSLSKWDVILTGIRSNHHPMFNMVKVEDENVVLVEPPSMSISGRQRTPYIVYNLTTACYVTSHAFVLGSTHLFSGNIGLVEVSPRIGLDIDTKFDLRFAEYLVKAEAHE